MRDCGNIKFLLLDPQLVEISRYQHCYPFFLLLTRLVSAPVRQTDRQREQTYKKWQFPMFYCQVVTICNWWTHENSKFAIWCNYSRFSITHIILYIEGYCVLSLHEMYSLCKLTTMNNRWYQSGGRYISFYTCLSLSILTCIYLAENLGLN